MEKLYQVTGYERQYKRLGMTYRYPVLKEYTTQPIIDQEMMEMTFVVVAAPENSRGLYINASVENPSQINLYPLISSSFFSVDDPITW